MGADCRLDDAGFDIGIRDSWKGASARSRPAAGGPTRSRPGHPSTRSAVSASPTGPSRWPSRSRQLGVFFDTIVVCTVTGSTHAGMIAGFAALEELTGVRRRVLGIDASSHDRQDPRPGRSHRASYRRAHRAGTRPATTRSPC